MSRVVAWFSAGAASATAADLALRQYGRDRVTVARCIVENEHPDNDRFAADVARWLGVEIVNLRSAKYRDCWDLWERRRFLSGPEGALCTTEMKKKLRREFSEPDDLHVFGLTWDETHRVARFRGQNPEVRSAFPLIERRWTKARCFYEIEKAGLELPMMYRLGYRNANCVGCVKGGAGYWNKIRRDFPGVFARMAALEARIGASCINGQPLATLPPDAGRHEDLDLPECGLFCGQNAGTTEAA